MPSSSRACAPSASCAISCVGDLLARAAGSRPRADVDAHELAMLAGVVGLELLAFAREVRAARCRLASSPRRTRPRPSTSRPRPAPAMPAISNVAVARVRRGDADEQARRRHDAVVGAEHGGAQPADARSSGAALRCRLAMCSSVYSAALVYSPKNSAPAEPIVMTTTAQRTNTAPRLHGEVRRAQRAYRLAPRRASRPSVHSHLIVQDEHDERGRREHEHERFFSAFAPTRVVAGAEHEAREHEQSHTDLNEAAVDADREEHRHLDEQARLARRSRAPRSSVRASAA